MKSLKAILYVDDDQDDREIFEEVIREAHPGFKCYLAEDAAEALQLLAQSIDPVCIFIDINMPKISGIDLLKMLHGNQAYSRIPTFMLTTSKEHELQTKTLGATGYYVKPNTYLEFFQLMKSCAVFRQLKK